MTTEPALEPLNRIVGTWATDATHPAVPGVIVHGTAVIEWLEGERFVIYRARTDHPDFPDAISVIGVTGLDRVDGTPPPDPTDAAEPQLSMHYFDSRGVFRIYHMSIDDHTWQLWRDAPGFSQRFTGTFADGENTIVGHWQLCRDDIRWDDDLQITYRRHW